jgi:hypothetical protein
MDKSNFYSSKEVKKILKIKDCDLAHIRNSGKLLFTKKGNAFMYSKESVDDFDKGRTK